MSKNNLDIKNNEIIKKSLQELNNTLKDSNELINMIDLIQKKFSGKDGAGLSSGTIIDSIVCEYLCGKNNNIQEYHNNEADIMINNNPFSLKKIKSKGSLALDWSKNKTNSNRERFCYNIIIIVTNTSKWWEKYPTRINNDEEKLCWNQEIKAGIYIIDKYWCKKNITVSSNNKTNTLIKDYNIYKMLLDAKGKNNFIPFNKNYEKKYHNYSFINGFT